MSATPEGSAPPAVWPGADGQPVSCREKLKMLAENHAEAAQVLRDVFEDAVLMGVDEAAMRRILAGLVEALPSPRQKNAGGGAA
ncbi:hypothetical protein EBE87_05175 [Pseudoroseomonas wenyumeiae]|uniref:Uncharacterized protein n=1 Tax=Teichococcus wenyumeiae TaxID=2478470 RepID=A0A3A9JGC2_9PROT|nr:hypothetical protein [Pseudoroseomonas wenyumeiae]RKK02686.1 hypothetical protein D6Z83_18420 [Pseudoroseomonas wenyumeiae]RMI26656.1 hypothetical protein EBE87_05175 [Pseudoroseomonas wenyumeiae]